jgi:hypothetical protein
MFDKLKEKWKNRPKKTSDKKTSSSEQRNVLLFLLVGALFGAITAYFSSDLLLLPLSILASLLALFLLQKKIPDRKEEKRKEEAQRQYRSFYHRFLLYVSLTSSGKEGLEETVTHAEISDLKDKLSQYLEDPSGPLPLIYTDSRLENRLIDEVTQTVHTDEEDYAFPAKAAELTEEYEEEIAPKKSHADPVFFFLLLSSLYLAGLLYSFFGAASA